MSTMEVDPLGISKRKAEDASPVRERHENQPALIATDNDRKRRETTKSDDLATLAGSSALAACSKNTVEDGREDNGDQENEEENEEESEDMSDDDDDDIDGGAEEEMDEFERAFYNEYDDLEDLEEEDMGPPEREVEEQEHSFGDLKLTFKIFLQEDDDEFTRWMQTIHVQCSHEGKVVGKAFGRYVNRNWIRSDFWRDMEEPCQELSSIAFELFDRYGRLKKELKDHPIRRGTGIWGSELDLGALFIIEYMLVEKDWRRKGVGTKIATCLIEKSRTGDRSPQFSLVAPGWLNHDIDSDIRGKTKLEQREVRFRVRGAAISFYRSLGFRRIGASRCFGLPTDPSHEAHTILSTADFDSADEEPEVDEGPEAESIADWVVEDARKSWRLKLLQERLPLHHAAITLADNDCVEFFKAFKKSETLADAWAKVDRYAKNVLHISACELKVKSVRWLLEHSNDGQILSSARNVDGYTPLEELESRLETKRTQMEHGMMVIVISDQFRGFPADAIGCLAALRQLPQVSTTQYLQLKFGCTCGSCVDGFLSPRMKFALLCQAEITHDMLNNDVEDAEMWCMMHDYLLIHVAPDIRQNFRTNKSYRQGFANVFDHIGSALRANKAPTIVNILDEWRNCSEWPPHTKNFFQRGGNAESALYIIFDQARDQDWWAGDGEHMEIFSEDVKALPECRNDHEFGFVALACGLSELAP